MCLWLAACGSGGGGTADAGAVAGADAAAVPVADPDAAAVPAPDPDAAPPPGDPDAAPVIGIAALSDEFDDPASLADWTLRHVVEGTPAQYTTLDIDTSTPGHLTIIPTQSGWYEESTGPLLFKLVTGDFAMRVSVAARRVSNPALPPTQEYNSAGLLARDPASVPGGQNWLMYNVGYQAAFVGTEGKTTVDSTSTLYLRPGGNSGELVLCRVGATFLMLRRLNGESSWTEEHRFTRADLPATLQAGIIVNGWEGPPDLRAEVDWIRFAVPDSLADCTTDIPPG